MSDSRFALIIHYQGDKPKKKGVGGTCSTYGERTETYGIVVGRLKERNNVENPGVDGYKILKYTLKKSVEMTWTALI
jgi:hypothetical protein